MTARTVDTLLDERSRLTAKNAATSGHLFAAESLLRRVSKLLPHLIADSPHNGAARDVLAEEIAELLAEDREHPGADALAVLDGMGGGEPPIPSGDAA